MYLKFEDLTFYNLSVYHYNLRDKQSCIITDSRRLRRRELYNQAAFACTAHGAGQHRDYAEGTINHEYCAGI